MNIYMSPLVLGQMLLMQLICHPTLPVLLLHVHKDETDKLDLTTIGNEFASRNSSRRDIFEIVVVSVWT